MKEAREIIEEVEGMGGMIKAIESGMAKLKIEEAATRKQVHSLPYLLSTIFTDLNTAKYCTYGGYLPIIL